MISVSSESERLTQALAEAEAFVCPVDFGSMVPTVDRPDVCECMSCSLLAPLWYLRFMGTYEAERDDFIVSAWERLTSTPVELADGRVFGKSRNVDDYAEIRYMLADGYEWTPNGR